MATVGQKSDVVTRIRQTVGLLTTIIEEVNAINGAWLGLGMQVGGEGALTDADIPGGPTAAQVAAAMANLNTMAGGYAVGSGARAIIERVRP